MIKLTHIIIYVENVSDTVSFYESALGLKRRFIHENGDYAEMSTGTTKLGIAAETLRAFNGFETTDNRLDQKPAGVEIAFTVEHVDHAYKKALRGGAEAVKEPTEKPWGQTVAYIRDNNGFLVAFGSVMKEEG